MVDRKESPNDEEPRANKRNERERDESSSHGRPGAGGAIPIPPADSPRRIGREPAVDRDAIAAREAGIYDDPTKPPPRAVDQPRGKRRRSGRISRPGRRGARSRSEGSASREELVRSGLPADEHRSDSKEDGSKDAPERRKRGRRRRRRKPPSEEARRPPEPAGFSDEDSAAEEADQDWLLGEDDDVTFFAPEEVDFDSGEEDETTIGDDRTEAESPLPESGFDLPEEDEETTAFDLPTGQGGKEEGAPSLGVSSEGEGPAGRGSGPDESAGEAEDDFAAGIFPEEEAPSPPPRPEPEPEPEPEGERGESLPPVEPKAEARVEDEQAEPKPEAGTPPPVSPEETPEPQAATGSGAESEPPASERGVSKRWVRETFEPAIAKRGERKAEFRTTSGHLLSPLYGVSIDAAKAFDEKVGYPGEFPFTRGIHPTMYRSRLWTMRQYAGFASATATNQRFRYLLSQGQTGLSVAFDLPTQIGYDSSDPWSSGEVGKVGVPINSLADMETLLEGIPLDEVSLSMTINSTAMILLLMVVAVAKKQGVDPAKLRGTVQNDMLKEFAARNTFRFPLDAHLRLTTDLFCYAAKNLPKWNLISVSGYHMREAGSTATQEVAFTLANGIAYVEKAIEAGLSVDEFAGQVSFFFASHNDLLEEVAKFRAARRLWAKIMKNRFGAKEERSLMLRFHTQTAGSTLTAKQPLVNVVRVTMQALAAVLGGTQSLHTNSFDEALGLPSREAALLALRTQQVVAHESGVTNAVDPIGGSPLVEHLTDAIEEDAEALIRKIDELGGAIEAVRSGWMKGEIEAAAYRAQQEIESGEQVVVGVNDYVMDDEVEPDVLAIDEEEVSKVLTGLEKLRRERDSARAEAALASLEIAAAWGDADLPDLVLECVESYCTIGEICASLGTVLGAGDEA